MSNNTDHTPSDVGEYKIANAFWSKFFGQKEKKKKQFWNSDVPAADVSEGSPIIRD